MTQIHRDSKTGTVIIPKVLIDRYSRSQAGRAVPSRETGGKEWELGSADDAAGKGFYAGYALLG